MASRSSQSVSASKRPFWKTFGGVYGSIGSKRSSMH